MVAPFTTWVIQVFWCSFITHEGMVLIVSLNTSYATGVVYSIVRTSFLRFGGVTYVTIVLGRAELSLAVALESALRDVVEYF